jgi:unsaturated rhamnogalacturonyl hydrolase
MHRTSRPVAGERSKRVQASLRFLTKGTAFTTCSFLLLGNLLTGTAVANQKKDEGEFSRYVGDSPSRALPFATDISPAVTHAAVAAVLQKVADWQLQKSQAHFDRDWTFAVLYTGFMAVPDEASGAKFRAAMKSMGEAFHWQLGANRFDANDQAVGQTYLTLYELDHDPAMQQPTREQLESMLHRSDAVESPLWGWCDALFMTPPVLAKLAQITNRPEYLDFMDREWWRTSTELYDAQQHLFYRDSRFLSRRGANGKPIFWARGNGWVLGGLARVLQAMPKDYPSRPKYIAQFQQMAAALIAAQRSDGLWSASLLDAENYPMAETSGTSLITYALAYGVNEGILEREQYQPHLIRAWQGLVAHIYADGRLGSIQPVADSPGEFKPTSSYVYGVGAFLLAGSEMYRMATR